MKSYSYTKRVDLFFEEAVEKTREELQKEGFGVLTAIDVKKTIKEKLDEDFNNYMILGACNPPLAFSALMSEQEIGLFLPCNLIIYSNREDEVFVSTILPTVAMGIIDNKNLEDIAKKVETKLKKVIDSIK